MMFRSLSFTPLLLLVMCLPAFAQGNPTGTISGRISDAQGGALPGVAITASSDALQGVRTVVSLTSRVRETT